MARTIQVDVEIGNVLNSLKDSELLAEVSVRGLHHAQARAALELDEWAMQELAAAVHRDDGRRVVDLLRPLLFPHRPLRSARPAVAH